MRVLILGGTRFIGPPTARRLYELGHAVVVFHRGETEADLPPAIEHLHGDRHRLSDIADQLRRLAPEVVLDLTAYTHEEAQTAVDTFRGVARRLVVVSSQDVYRAYGRFHGKEAGPLELEPAPTNEDAPLRTQLYPYRGQGRGLDGYEKILVERAAASAPDLPATVLRLPAVYGEGDEQHRLFLELTRMDDGRPAILLEEHLARWRWTRAYVENAAQAIALAVTDERAAGRIYNAGEEEALTYAEWVREIGRAAGWSGQVLTVAAERLPRQLQPPPGDYEQHLVADTTRIRQELGFREVVSREEGLRRAIAWERAHRPHGRGKLFDYAAEDALLADLRGAT
jgi:nucleoside-diphosphate-sugar epimerase